VNVVREDPVRRGLLFLRHEQAVYVSFADGDGWQPLRLKCPRPPSRDLIVKGDDLAVATHGRGFWILDDSNRCASDRRDRRGASAPLHAAGALRIRWNTNTDTPLRRRSRWR